MSFTKTRIWILGILISQSVVASTIFDRVSESFDKSDVPVAADIRGYWGGRCVDKTRPDKLMAAVFVYKHVKVVGDFPSSRPTMSYFYDVTGTESQFDKMSPSQIENHPGVNRWFAKEQWKKATETNGSIENDFVASEKVTIHRALRSYVSQFDKTLVLQVSRMDRDEGIDTNVYCFFDNYRGKDTSIEPPPVPHLSAEVGPIANSFVDLVNSYWTQWLSSYQISNLGAQSIHISHIQWYTPAGEAVMDPRRYLLRGGETISFSLAGRPSFQLRSLRFFVSGSTSRIRVSGVPAN